MDLNSGEAPVDQLAVDLPDDRDDRCTGLFRRDLGTAELELIAGRFAVQLHNRQEFPLASGGRTGQQPLPSVVVGYGDGPHDAEVALRLSATLRRYGCTTLSIGAVTASAMRFGVHHLDADGGVHASSGGLATGRIGVRLLDRDSFSESVESWQTSVSGLRTHEPITPTRRGGSTRSFDVTVPYSAAFLKHFRGTLGQGVAVECDSKLWLKNCRRVGDAVGLSITDPTTSGSKAFELVVDPEGERTAIHDELRNPVGSAELISLLSRDALREHPGSSIVLDWDLARKFRPLITSLGGDCVPSNSSPRSMAATIRDHRGLLGFDSTGRIWYRQDVPTADVLLVLAHLARILSRSREPLSKLLRREALLRHEPAEAMT
ncbi:hypothetical protein [Stratiformator vulcanicus]|uniref:hypothetical protein n=1 Tax=Stratiformator vulcanicus TaxID=2527980 RepID=UPI00119C93F8|nr:hypothetical protein [Stratiformator vulcanicus]